MMMFFRNIIYKISTAPIWLHLVALILSIVWFNWIKAKLDASYLDSKHPVDYFTGQTSFSGSTIKSYYQTMIDAGTLDIYKITQFIDFGFIVGFVLIGLFLGAMIVRFAKPNGWARKAGLTFASLLVVSGFSDAIENLISFVMLANPTGFSNWIAIPYSVFAVIKFICITLSMLAFILAICLLMIERFKRV